ncbi:MAG: hypothetical protein SFV53_03635 [Rickettsiales bacterium]|nr:hypothetical protein [Rickettsiales bacterium]
MLNTQNYITNNQALSEVIKLIDQAKLVAIDTEFTREKTYYPILSLIQIAVNNSNQQKLFIIDALSGIDLQPLITIIFDRNITKIFHASLQDLQIFCQKFGRIEKKLLEDLAFSVIDTQIMANFCGFSFNTGYSNLAEILLQKNIDKTLQRSDWQKRPLSLKQLEYALCDVIFLEEIYQKLSEVLKQKKRQEWYEQEMRIFVDKATTESVENLFKNFSFKGKSREQINKIKNLILWREGWAKKLNLPRQHFMRDYVVERIAYEKDFDLTLDEQKISEIKKIINEDFDEDKIFAHKISSKISSKGENNFMSDEQKNLYKKAKELVAKIAREENLKEQILITNNTLKNLICDNKSIEKTLTGWRYEIIGEPLKKLIATYS